MTVKLTLKLTLKLTVKLTVKLRLIIYEPCSAARFSIIEHCVTNFIE